MLSPSNSSAKRSNDDKSVVTTKDNAVKHGDLHDIIDTFYWVDQTQRQCRKCIYSLFDRNYIKPFMNDQ